MNLKPHIYEYLPKLIQTIALLISLNLSPFLLLAQKPVTSYIVSDVPASPQTFSLGVAGYPVSGTKYYLTNRTFDIYYATHRNGTNGVNRIVTGFTTSDGSTFTYEKYNASGGTIPFNKVVFNRIEPSTPLGAKFTALYELNSIFTSTGDSLNNPVGDVPDRAKTYLEPSAETTMEAFMNSYALNKGTDNVFSNTSGQNTFNNIERIDLIYTGGIRTSISANLSKIGFLINDRGGNDPFKVAAITGINAEGNVTSVATLKSLSNSINTWLSGTPTNAPVIRTVVIQKDANSVDFKPSQVIGFQTVKGVFISLQDLGIGINTTIYGLAIYAGDHPENSTPTELVDLSNSILTTDGVLGGLDLLSGNFVARDITVASPSLSGNVYHDPNGLTGSPPNTIDGAGIGSPTSTTPIQQLYANLLDAIGNVVLSTTVNADGSFNFPSVNPGIYSIQLTQVPGEIFKQAPTTELPDNWAYIGEYNGVGVGSDGLPNGILPNIEVNIDNITTPKFGIELRPESNNQILNISDKLLIDVIYSFPSLSKQSKVPALSGSDPEDKPASTTDSISTGGTFTITELPPANQAILYYDDLPITVNSPIVNYDPSKLQIKFVDITLITTSFRYTITDAAGLTDLTPALYQINLLTLLPATPIQLKSEVKDNGILLIWMSSTPTPISHFEVQQSLDGISFFTIGKLLNMNHNDNNSTFQYLLPPGNNENYLLRIAAHYSNGNIQYSNIITSSISNKIQLYPNPAKNYTLLIGLRSKSSLEIYDNNGRFLKKYTTDQSTFTIPTQLLQPGIYWLKIIQDKNATKSIRFTIE
jgi:hypothetical protein